MLYPDYLLRVSEPSEEIASELHAYILSQIVERIVLRIGRGDDYIFTPRDYSQVSILQESGELMEDIAAEIAKLTKVQQKEILAAMNEAGVKALEYDDKVYADAGLSPIPLQQSPYLTRVIERGYNATANEWENFTRTTAQAAQQTFVKAVDKAYTLAVSGAVSTSQAVREAVNEVAQDGVYIEYPSGRKDTIETATLRAVRTGIAQMSSEITIARMDEMDWDIILTSAHLGARTGDGGENPGNHEWWQGKFLSRLGKSNFPDFVKTTGYGTVTGLSGTNCRHSFGPGDGKHNPFKDIDTGESRKIEKLNKQQRALERRIRKTKRTVQVLKTAIDACKDEQLKFDLQQDYDKKSFLLSQQNKAYRDFNEENGLRNLDDRLRIAGWDREQAAAARGAATRYKNLKEK